MDTQRGDKAVLILSRRNGESFIIGDDIKITVLSQRSNQVRIGIDAPRDLPVFREEVLERRKQQNKSCHDQDNQTSLQSIRSETSQPSTPKRPEVAIID